jgi:pyridoxamine 5'-phosphate oxidase
MTDKPDLGIEADDLASDPILQFRRWMEDAESEGIHLSNAAALATSSADGSPSVRHVLIRGFDERGFSFFTNLLSRKAVELAANPRAALALLWRELDRQVTARGVVRPCNDAESDAWFARRPREAQIAAWASPQSAHIEDRPELMARFERFEARYPDGVPRPPYFGGYRLEPDEVEFWQSRAFRLHDRLRYLRHEDGDWRTERLAP